MARYTITPAPPSVTCCKPNLMPFHIEYNGTAPISTFLHVQDAKKNIGAPEEPVHQTPTTEVDDESQKTVVDSETGSETVVTSSSSSSTLVATTSIETSSQVSTSANQQLSDLPNRYISTFRGRTIHGLAVDVPEGLTGVVLRSERAGSGLERQRESAAVREKEQLKAAAAAAKWKKGKGKADDAGAGRRTRSSARRAVEDEDMDVDEDLEDEDDVSLLGEEEEWSGGGGTPINLVPTSNFSSFMLWHPDIPVDTGKDEYFGTISEWMKIAQMIHRVEDG
ncbi:hypothetical protein E1B28_013727 [Marasmius oreades]|uniref:Uncharacterized protein n=1 Tax=Marasmius oreades TaxID=181124 RepID=A0A9P7RR81_9AGAR|nr:uncharacterized protein E1B28_013727 [Marasmius oreades]KAG7087786.1 hypothetical protein E1B28_013727 [Marasmius oreades]